jgi:toxin-antitoxin system PIN domain toxin
MISVDTNVLLYAQNADCPEHGAAWDFLLGMAQSQDVAICELVLVELYLLLRNPAVVREPLGPVEAAELCRSYRANPRWRLIENAPVMETVWAAAGDAGFARRRIIDLRLALTLQHHGVTELATANVKDFEGLGFERVWNPVA